MRKARQVYEVLNDDKHRQTLDVACQFGIVE